MASPRAYTIDLRSDTLTKPTESMKKAMFSAPLGDDVFGEDPTVNAFEKRIAMITGKQAALFVASGTMANLIAIMTHCNKRGAEIIVGEMSHIFKYEQGGPAQIAGVMISTIPNNPDGTFDLGILEQKIRGEDIHEPKTTMVAVENTHNMCGGKVVPMSWINQLTAVAQKHSLLLHMDGSRLFNAAAYLNEDIQNIVKGFDSVSVCFSKGLGAPIGSALVGSFSFIRQARRFRKALGGGWRQAGIIAAAANVSLDEIVPALIGDHRRARFLAEAIASLRSSTFTVDLQNLQTNILLVDVDKNSNVIADKVVERLQTITEAELSQGCVTDNGEGIVVKAITRDSKTFRLTVYFEISDVDIAYTIKKLMFVLKEMESRKGFFG